MTPREIELVSASFDEIHEIAEPLVMLFYGRLFDLNPALRELFHIEMEEQSRKLTAMLEVIVASLDCFDTLRPTLRELGRRHVEYGTKAEHYDTVTAALIWAIGQALQDRFYPELKDAWTHLIQSINEEMKIGAAAQ